MSFLDITPFDPKDRTEYEPQLSNWLRVAKLIYNTADADLILRLLQIELTGLKREFIIDRLYARFSALRAATEKWTFLKQFEGAEPIPELSVYMASWDTITVLNLTPEEILRIAQHEYVTKRRYYILHRLYTRYATIRREQEKELMRQWSPKSISNSISETV